jgi:predicted DNA-binding WGR domain protein
MTSRTRAIHGLELRCTTPPHRKFWRAFIAGNHYVVNYGRIGDPGSFRGSKACTTTEQVKLAITTKIREKIDEKGYATHVAPITFTVPEALIADLDGPEAVRERARAQLVDYFTRAAGSGVA